MPVVLVRQEVLYFVDVALCAVGTSPPMVDRVKAQARSKPVALAQDFAFEFPPGLLAAAIKVVQVGPQAIGDVAEFVGGLIVTFQFGAIVGDGTQAADGDNGDKGADGRDRDQFNEGKGARPHDGPCGCLPAACYVLFDTVFLFCRL